VNSPDAIGRESLVEYVKELLPNPIRDSEGLDGALTLVGGDPGEVIVRLTADDFSISVFSVRWDGPHTPRVLPRPFASLAWSQLPAASLMMAIRTLVAAASEVRRRSYSLCERCGKTHPPEWMHDDSTCQSCAERELGAVH
jgi:hypothetical protein